MPDISNRGQLMPESPIRKLVPFAEKARKKGRTIYHLNIGQPDIETPEIARASVKENNLKVIEYGHSAGVESYRRKLTHYYKKYKIDLEYSDILITTGGSEAVVFTFLSCLNPGDEVIIPEPFYANYMGFAIMAGVKILPITSRIETGFALPPIEEFEKRITPETRAILICNPNNPTGYIYSNEELWAIRNIVRKHDLYLFADEVYKEFRYEEGEYLSALHLEGIESNVVVMDSISKRYSACGMRIGAMITRNKEINNTVLKFGQARLCPPAYGQIAGEAAIDTPESYFNDVRTEYLKRRNIVVEALNKIEGVICPKPKGAFYAGARLPVDDADKFCQWLLEEFEYNNQTVMLAPMSGFYATPGLGKNEVRIGYVLNTKALRNAMQCIENALKIYPGKTI